MRIRGRRLYPSTLSERRVMMSLGGTPLYTPRGVSPYLLARRVTRAAMGESGDFGFVRDVLARHESSRMCAAVVEPVRSPVEAEAPSGQATVAA